MKRTFIQCMAVLILMTGLHAQNNPGGTVYTLQQCVELAIKNNADVRNAEYQAEVNKVNLQIARGNMFPNINGNIGHNLYNGRSINPYTNGYITQSNTTANYQVTGSIVLWNGSSIQNYIRQQSLLNDAGKMDLQQFKDATTVNVILAYVNVLSAQEQLNASERQAEVTRQRVSQLEIKNQQGSIAPSDLFDMRGNLGNDEISIVSNRQLVETAKLTLSRLMNITYSKDMMFQKIDTTQTLSPYDASSDQVYDYASKNLALIKAVDLRSQAAEKAVKSARGQLLPTLSLGGSVNTNYSSVATTTQVVSTSDVLTDSYVFQNGQKSFLYSPQSNVLNPKISYGSQLSNNIATSIGIGLNVPILNGFLYRSRLRQAKASNDLAKFNTTTVRNQLKQAIEQDYVNMTSAFDTYKTLARQTDDYRQSFKAAEVKLDAGVLTTVDYVIVKNNFDRATINLIAAKYNYLLQTKILDYYMGRALF